MTEIRNGSPLAQLPAELILQIFSYFGPIDLAHVAQSCKILNEHSKDDQLWIPHVNRNLPIPIGDAGPLKSFRDLYTAHHPHWFLPKQQIWFGDYGAMGNLLISRYEPETGRIAAYTVTAIRGTHHLQFWEKDREVIIHSFDPIVSLDLDRPVVNIDLNPSKREDQHGVADTGGSAQPSKYSKEIMMDLRSDPGLCASFMLCRALPDRAIFEGAAVWPPLRFPANARTRNESADNFRSLGHFPSTVDEISQHNFRMRRWVEYSGRGEKSSNMGTFLERIGPYIAAKMSSAAGGIRIQIPERITTFATLPLSAYTPTAKKPWQGIWCGDYSGHGCEFLLMLQPDKEEEKALPSRMTWMRQWFRGSRRRGGSPAPSFASAQEEIELPEATGVQSQSSDGLEGPETSAEPGSTPVTAGPSRQRDSKSADEDETPSGRLEAIKLTGDPNIPRGEYTFIAPDIGQDGLIRIADEELFRGARIVRSAGHVAGAGFQSVRGELPLSGERLLGNAGGKMEDIDITCATDMAEGMVSTDIALLCILHPASREAQNRCLELLRKSAREYYRNPKAKCKIWSYYTPSPLFGSPDVTVGGLELYTTKQAFSDQLNDPVYFQSYRNAVERESLYSEPAKHTAWYPVAGFATRETNAEPFGGVIVTNSRLVCKDREAVLDLWRPFSEWVRQHEPGVLSYMAFTRPKAPKEILLFERFKDKKVLIDRRDTPEHKDIAENIEALLEKGIINSTTYWQEVDDSFVSNVVGGQTTDRHKL